MRFLHPKHERRPLRGNLKVYFNPEPRAYLLHGRIAETFFVLFSTSKMLLCFVYVYYESEEKKEKNMLEKKNMIRQFCFFFV